MGGRVLQTTDGKPVSDDNPLPVKLAGAGFDVSWDDVQDKPADFPPSSHTHPIAEVDGLQGALDSKMEDVTQADIAPLVDGLPPIADPSSATVEQVANAYNALLAALGGPTE